MSHRETFYLLNDTFSATLAPNFLCTVVASKSSPRTVSAPFTPADHPATALSDPSAALAHALPIPATISQQHTPPFFATVTSSSLYTLDQFLSAYCSDAPRAQIHKLFDLPADAPGAATASIAVRQYSLDNPQIYFERLIQDSRRAKDVRALLNQCLPRYAYFVTGFITVTDAAAQPNRSPFTETLRFAPPFLQLPHHQSPYFHEHLRARFSHEHIFAVSYAVVKLSTSQGSSSKAGSTMPPDFGRPTRANGTHIASASRTMEHWTNEQTARSVPSTPLTASATLAHAAVSAASPARLILDENEPFLREPSTDALFFHIPKSS
ncbi:hypothetical protein VHEMI07521 [[Torrubiella] hemipterigena]|uniref:Uncharacterized protein n=1 Tax=[Torrubiella] hemipterigena TaxID=1531966 RepID=A0A0A1TLU3_9HYPO|nr:hypothetical protein VHEMI07521 [[Torrubiella] hemipterigena]